MNRCVALDQWLRVLRQLEVTRAQPTPASSSSSSSSASAAYTAASAAPSSLTAMPGDSAQWSVSEWCWVQREHIESLSECSQALILLYRQLSAVLTTESSSSSSGGGSSTRLRLLEAESLLQSVQSGLNEVRRTINQTIDTHFPTQRITGYSAEPWLSVTGYQCRAVLLTNFGLFIPPFVCLFVCLFVCSQILAKMLIFFVVMLCVLQTNCYRFSIQRNASLYRL